MFDEYLKFVCFGIGNMDGCVGALVEAHFLANVGPGDQGKGQRLAVAGGGNVRSE